jgi:hypothetical protein
LNVVLKKAKNLISKKSKNLLIVFKMLDSFVC